MGTVVTMLQPGDSLIIQKMVLSMGFSPLVSLQSAIEATGLLVLMRPDSSRCQCELSQPAPQQPPPEPDIAVDDGADFLPGDLLLNMRDTRWRVNEEAAHPCVAVTGYYLRIDRRRLKVYRGVR